MSKIDELSAYGANVEEGVKRCVNNEDFYLKMVTKAVQDSIFDNLTYALNAKDYDLAFEVAHALKGVLANLALTPLCDPVSEVVELLRNKTDTDYSPYLEKISAAKAELEKIIE